MQMSSSITAAQVNCSPAPSHAEAAFYAAFERADVDAMMAVWSDDEAVFCVHPGGGRLVRRGGSAGRVAVDLFRTGLTLRFELIDLQAFTLPTSRSIRCTSASSCAANTARRIS